MDLEFRHTLRQTMREKRSHVSTNTVCEVSQKIVSLIIQAPWYQSASHIAFYKAVNQEIDLHDLWIDACHQGKTCYFPVITERKTLLFFKADLLTPFFTNRLHIEEPLHTDLTPQAPDAIDLIFLPLLVFDNKGNRLGTGAGFYDRTLEGLAHMTQPYLVGVAYDFQQVATLPDALWDIPLDCVVTERCIMPFKGV